jgi:hypothetical protein
MAHKKIRALMLFLALFTLGSILLAACTRQGAASTSSSSSSAPSSPTSSSSSCPSGDTVQTVTSNFAQSCITLSKSGTLKVVPGPGSTFHILDYGQWNNGTAQPATPASVLPLKNVQVTSSSVSIGPFTTAGTYHMYYTVHPGMNLTVIVK